MNIKKFADVGTFFVFRHPILNCFHTFKIQEDTSMKKTLLISLIIGVFCIAASAQKISKPTLTAKPATEVQSILIRQGVAFHDAKRYNDAIAIYEKVLAENPDCAAAIYELALTYYTKGDTVKAMETANRGSKYTSDELPLFYGIMANVIDDVGKPYEAIQIYRDAIKILEGDKQFLKYLSSLHYNLGVTYVGQNKYNDARIDLKRAVEYDNKYASPHYLLSIVYDHSKYKVPAMLAAARLISLEFNSQRAQMSAAIFSSGMKPAGKDEKTGNISITLDLNAPKDEGDFGTFDLLLGTLTTFKDEKDKNKSEAEIFADAVEKFAALISEDKKLRSTFIGKNYVPFIVDMKKQGHTKAFAYLVLYNNGNADALKWLKENGIQLEAFINWSKAYALPK